jgi:RNA polymerase sigma factor (sigma-70 family)
MTPQQNIERRAIFTIAYRDYYKKLNKQAIFKISDRLIGEDLVQDTFMKTWSYLVKGGKIDSMKSFLYHVLSARIVDHYRKKNKTTSLDTLAEKGFEPSDDSEERLLNQLDGKAALLLILLLPLKFQAIVRMHYIDGLSASEMSLKNGQSKSINSVHLHRALKKLKILYKPAMIWPSNVQRSR